jgi:hypothetical protein
VSDVTARTDFSHLAGERFHGDRFTLAGYEAWLWDDAVEVTPETAAVHPGCAYMIGLHGGGRSITDIMELLETAYDSGVMLGEIEFEFNGTLTPESSFDVEGEVLEVERKHGRRAGTFDRVRFAHRLRAADAGAESEPVAVVTHTWIVPRKEEA